MSNLKNKKQIKKVNKTIITHSNLEKSLSSDDEYWAFNLQYWLLNSFFY